MQALAKQYSGVSRNHVGIGIQEHACMQKFKECTCVRVWRCMVVRYGSRRILIQTAGAKLADSHVTAACSAAWKRLNLEEAKYARIKNCSRQEKGVPASKLFIQVVDDFHSHNEKRRTETVGCRGIFEVT